jgi:hypothetical protein
VTDSARGAALAVNGIALRHRLKTSLGYGPTQVFHSIRKTAATLFEKLAYL